MRQGGSLLSNETLVPLDRVVYQVNEAARLLRLPDKTLRRWLDGDRKFDRTWAPLIRSEPTGIMDLTWGEFVEAGLLAEYRTRALPIERLRPLMAALREKLGTAYPLAHARPLYADGREMLWREQVSQRLDEDLFLVVRDRLEEGYQLALTDIARQFVSRVEFEPPRTGVVARWYPLGPSNKRIALDPRIAFGLPTVNGIRTEAIAELRAAGEKVKTIAEVYREFGVTPDDVTQATSFEQLIRVAA